MLTKCFILLKAGHEMFFLQELDPHPDREAYLSNLASPSTPPNFFPLFLFCHLQILLLHSFIAPCTPHFISKGDPPSTSLLLPSHQFCIHSTLHWPFSSLLGQKKLALRRKAVWVGCFFCCYTIHFLPV